MYYLSIIRSNIRSSFRVLFIGLALLISILTFQEFSFADEMLYKAAEDYRAKGYEEQQKGNYDLALTYYGKALSMGLQSPVIYNDVGVVYEQLGLFNKTEASYLKAIEIDSNYLPAYTNLAFFYQDRGQWAKASQYFKERYYRSKDDDPWKPKIKKALIKINPEFRNAFINAEAEELSSTIIQKAQEEFYLSVTRSERHFQEGQQLLKEMKFDEAIAAFDRALSETPANPKILKIKDETLYAKGIHQVKQETQRAIGLLEEGDVDGAQAKFQHILTILPNETKQ